MGKSLEFPNSKSPSAIFYTYHQKIIYFEVMKSILDLSFLTLWHIILRPYLKFQYVPSWQSTDGYRNMAKSSSFPHFFLYFLEV